MADPKLPNWRPFWRYGNEGVPRPPGAVRKRDRPPDGADDTSCLLIVPPQIKLMLVEERGRTNCTISALVRRILSSYLDVVEMDRRRGPAENPDHHRVDYPGNDRTSILLRVYLSQYLKRRLITYCNDHNTSMSQTARDAIRDYFFNQLLDTQHDVTKRL